MNKQNGNIDDKHAVNVMKEDDVVGHISREFSRAVWYFLIHGGSAHCEVTENRRRAKD